MRTVLTAVLVMMFSAPAAAQSGAAQEFAACESLQSRDEHAAAADCFVGVYRDHPDDQRLMDKALFNAAQCFEKVSEVGKAIQVRIMLVKAAPDSPLTPETVLDIARSYHRIAVYAEAAKFYELFAANYPDTPEAPSALANAVTLYAGLQRYDKAIGAGELYGKLFSERKPAEANEIALMVAEWLRKTGEIESSLSVYRDLAILRTQPTVQLRALAELGEHESSKEARLAGLDEARRLYRTLEPGRQQDMLDVYMRVELSAGELSTNEVSIAESGSLGQKAWNKIWDQALKDAQRARFHLEEVAAQGRPRQKVSALVKLGRLYESLASILDNTPRKLTKNQDEQLRGFLSADDPTAAAVAAYLRAVDVAEHELVLGEDVDRARQRLRDLDPETTVDSELVPGARYLGEGFQRSDIEKTAP